MEPTVEAAAGNSMNSTRLGFAKYYATGRLFPSYARGNHAVILRRGVGTLLLVNTLGSLILLPNGVSIFYGVLPLFLGGVLSCFLIAGFLLPISIPLLLLSTSSVVASAGGFWSLGVDASIWALIALVFYPGNSRADIDQILVRRGGRLGRLLKQIYSSWGMREESRLLLARWFSLLAFSLTAAYSVALHRQDAYWESGLVGPLLLTSSFMSRFDSLWISVLGESAAVVSALSLLSAVFIPVFGLLWLALFFRGRIVAAVVRAATISFFLFSLVFLQLGILPVVEILLWIFWFVPRRLRRVEGCPTREPAFVVLYDDMCNLCQGTRRLFGRLDTTRVIRWSPVSKSARALDRMGLSRDEATADITALTSSGQLLQGFTFYLRVVPWIPTLALLTPLLIAGRLTKVGPFIYSFVKKRRTRRAEYCELTPRSDSDGLPITSQAVKAFIDRSEKKTVAPKTPVWERTFVWSLAICAGVYAISNPLIARRIDASVLTPDVVQALSHTYGFNPIDVFNTADLRMSEHWISVKAREGGTWKLVPITHDDGSRGVLQLIDAMYFGATLPSRRAMIGMTQEERCRSMQSFIMNPRISSGIRLMGLTSTDFIKLELYEQGLPTISGNGVLVWETSQPRLLCTYETSGKDLVPGGLQP